MEDRATGWFSAVRVPNLPPTSYTFEESGTKLMPHAKLILSILDTTQMIVIPTILE